MNFKLLLFGLLPIILCEVKAQNGNYFLSHYSPADERIDFRGHDMVQDSHGEIYFANRAGILEFDGLNWNVVSVPAAVYTLVADGTEILIGGLSGAGKLNEKIQSPRSYEMFSDASGIFSSTLLNGKAYFCSEKQLLIYSIDSRKVDSTIQANPSTGNFSGVFNLDGLIVVSTEKHGLFKLEDNKLAAHDFAIHNLLFSIASPSQKKFLLGTKDNRLFILSGTEIREIKPVQTDFLSHHILSDGVWVSEKTLALGTLRGGVIFIDTETGATEGIVDYINGLPDNEVFSLMKDKNDGVWVAHEYGFTRIATNLPFRSFHNYPGLQGNLLCVRPFQDKIYVGTTLGLFVLSQKEEVHVADNKRKVKSNPDPLPAPTMVFEYKKVHPITDKVSQLLEINGSLIAYGPAGLFEINGQSARAIIDEPVRNVFSSASLKQVIVSTWNNQVKTFVPGKDAWRETHLFDSLHNHFSFVFEDKLENVWLCGSTFIYKVETVDNEVLEIIKYPIQNPTEDEVLGLALGSQVYVVSSGQFKHFNGTEFVKYDSLPSGRRYFASGGSFWFNDGAKWRTIDRQLQSMKLEWLGIFPNLRFLSPDSNHKSLWAITDKNELYKFNSEQADSSEALYPLYLRHVEGAEVKVTTEVEIEQSESAFSFEFIRPDYIGTHANQYRYLVKGLTREWTSWSPSNNVINFSYLPAGSYQLMVQSKNALGAESGMEEVAFQVLPPYWKRWWFYALEFVVFSFLVSLSIHMARNNSRYRYISQILTILTVIMLIQFIQTAIGSVISIKSSPVVDFFVQVSIALLVFPVEIIARNTMQRIVHNKYSVQRLFNTPDEQHPEEIG